MIPQDALVNAGQALAMEHPGVGIARFLLVLVAIVLAVTVLRVSRRALVARLRPRLGPAWRLFQDGTLILNYFVGLALIILIVRFSGINLNALTVVFGALSVGIGFGLQNIVNNFVSGIVLLLERPVRIDDRVIIDQLEGTVIEIGIRATTVLTNEGVAMIVPNSEFITRQVVNRSLDGGRTRFRVPVGVAYGSDPRHVERVLLDVAAAHDAVLPDPPPMVVFDEFGDRSMRFFLWVWTESHTNLPTVFRSELNFAIHAALAEAGIAVPCLPQVEVSLRSAVEA